MARAKKVCSGRGCASLVPPGQSRCPACSAKADAARRPNGNPYSTAGHRSFRAAVLARDPICVICQQALATVADHYPIERRDLVRRGMDPDEPDFGRGVCDPCHRTRTARDTPGGWAAG